MLLVIVVSNLMSEKFDQASRNLYVKPPPGIEHFIFGFSQVMADSLWIRVIQDFSYCESLAGKSNCVGNGWVYSNVNTVSLLSPHFRLPVYFGGLLLTIVVKDSEGASKIFDRAVALFPDDWHILYAAAYQAIFEEDNKPKAAKLLEAAAKNGAPSWVYALATKMYNESGQRELSLRLYQTLKESGASDEILVPVRNRLFPDSQKELSK